MEFWFRHCPDCRQPEVGGPASSSSSSTPSLASITLDYEKSDKTPRGTFLPEGGTIKIATWNTAGLCGARVGDKVPSVKRLLGMADIVALQETHDTDCTVGVLLQEYNFDSFSAPSSIYILEEGV